jgi:hypothetical protein
VPVFRIFETNLFFTICTPSQTNWIFFISTVQARGDRRTNMCSLHETNGNRHPVSKPQMCFRGWRSPRDFSGGRLLTSSGSSFGNLWRSQFCEQKPFALHHITQHGFSVSIVSVDNQKRGTQEHIDDQWWKRVEREKYASQWS